MSRDILTYDQLNSKFCGEISYKIGSDWSHFGRHLGLSDSDLDNIDSDYRKCNDKADNVLKKWKQINGHLSWEHVKKNLEDLGRRDIVVEIERKFGDYLSSLKNISTIECRIPYGCVFKLDSQVNEICKVEFQLCNNSNNWKVINNKKHDYEYYLTKKKNATLFVKVENLLLENEKFNFKFSFQDSRNNSFQGDGFVCITGNCDYELLYNGLFIATPEPIFNSEFSKYMKTIESVDWRKTNKVCLDKVPDDKSIELIALDYFDRNFPDWNDVIYVSPSIANSDNLDFVVSKFINLFTVNFKGIRAVFPGYRLQYHASLLKCNIEKFTNCNDENRITIFVSDFNLVIIARIATSTDCLKLESESCLNDIMLFVNVNNPVLCANKLIVLGIVVLPLHDRIHLKEELFFHFSEKFHLHQFLFLCKDDFGNENFESWWKSVEVYCMKKVNTQNNEILFKKLISLTMILMAKVDICYPTLESDTQKQIQTLLLNVEQRNAINDKALQKIITGGYGSGKSIVGKEIIKNCIAKKSENPYILYYICCNHFSLYECHMKEFVDTIEKTSNVEVVYDNLYNLWKNMYQNENISNNYISLPILLKYLATTKKKKICFVLEELSEEYVKEEDAIQLKNLFTSLLKDTLVVFIPESITKNRELIINKQKYILQKNFFQEDLIGMKVITLNKSMRVTKCNKLLIDIAQKAICETKCVLNIPNKKKDLQNVENNVKDNKEINDTSHFDTIKDTKYNNYASVNIEKSNRYASNISNDKTVDNYSDSNSNQSSEKKENKFIDTDVKDFHDIDLDHMAKIITKNDNNIDPNSYMETEYVFKSSIIGHSIKGEKPKVVYLPFYDITDKQSVKVLSIILEKLCFNVLRKTVVICNNMEEVQSTAYAIDIIKIFKAVIYSPHLQKYSPTLQTKIEVQKKLKSELDILVTDCKGFSGAESQSVIVFVSPEEIYLRHVLVDAISRSNSHLTVLVKNFKDSKKPLNKDKILKFQIKRLKDKIKSFRIKDKKTKALLNEDKTIGNVLTSWSDKKVIEEIIIATSNTENRKSKDVFFVINENCKEFIDRGSTKDFEIYKENSQFQIFHENNFIYETLASDLPNQVEKDFKKMSRNELTADDFIPYCCELISNKIGSDWIQLGRHLGLSDSDLKYIDSYSIDSYKKADKVLKTWNQTNGHISWELLKNVLIAFKRLDIVLELERKLEDLLVSAKLKHFYLERYGKIYEVQPPLKAPVKVDLIHKFTDLCIVDAAETRMDAVLSVERKEFLEKQIRYTPVTYSEIFMREKSVILISGIAGIGKTWLLRKCLLDWSNGLIWKNVELVFYLECRKINQYENISTINDLLSVFYKDIISNFNISIHTTLFIIDGLDEFKFFNELSNPGLKCNYPIVNVLAEIQNYKHLVAGRVYAIDQYQSIYTDRSDKYTIQIMGFNKDGITNYVENNVNEENKEIVKATLKESPIAKAMASVPFYLSSMCKNISDSKNIYKHSFLTMTDLYANIFLYFLQKHIIKDNKTFYQIMENDSNKKYILIICKIAFKLLVENKVIFSKVEFQTFVSGFDNEGNFLNEGNFFGFIEKIETNLGCYYQFAHLTIMEFCASVFAYNCLSSDKIMTNKKLKSCLSMICGLANKNQNSCIKFLNLNPSKNFLKESLPLFLIFDRLSKSDDFNDYHSLFIECFYESGSSFTDEINSIVDKRGWVVSIKVGKTSYDTSCENYFVNHYIKSGRKLSELHVDKNILSNEEKNLLIQCSVSVRVVEFHRPTKFEEWKPKDKIEVLRISISDYLLTKKDFEEIFFPWVDLCEELVLRLHDDIDFFKDFYKWIRHSNIKKFKINYRGKDFRNL
ncbi:uncharacterized protein LOC105848505 isoform X2 [Hydra vulgaris]|uniref:uncharacterized protein LOC105848505 isoform X2 n=1 Tax=Hydra vulgaris TaxID=6087 RepID=UPI001F5EF358|nr:uncharacterized protein LOC105848505 isoform X2 [Hydra vulgaris]